MSEATSRPESLSELLPEKIYKAEILMVPFFWFAPLMVLFVGSSIAFDIKELKKKYGVEPRFSHNLFYIIVFVLGHLGSLTYRFHRRRQITQKLGFDHSSAYRKLDQYGGKYDRALTALVILQTLALATLVVAPERFISQAADLTVTVMLANILAGPVLVYRDIKQLKRVENIEWSRSRYAHIFFSAVPLAVFIYLIQRQEHTYYAMLLDNWDRDPEEFNLDESEKNKIEKLTDRINQKMPI